ncbi:MAG: NAD(P)/FAD-dependent oxidoreductase [Acidimicrobiales bacterium]
MSTPPDVIVGAGPAGLTAAWELVARGVRPVIVEADPVYVGGLSRTVEHGGNRFDIGGHRFFTKSAEIAAQWDEMLPGEFLTVPRLSRIYFDGAFYPYPVQIGPTLRQLGLRRGLRIVGSYLRARVRPRSEVTFEDWVVNRFGHRLYELFFRTYTEKVWGLPCDEISKDFAAQRIRGLSLFELVTAAVRPRRSRPKTLIEQFRYPRLGPGQLWEAVADQVVGSGARLFRDWRVGRIEHRDGRVVAVESTNGERVECRDLYTTMSLRDLVAALSPAPPADVLAAAAGLRFRDFLTVAVVVNDPAVFPDTWIYIHDPGVGVGRIQNYRNWSTAMVGDDTTTCLGLEYFCNRDDGVWSLSDDALGKTAVEELAVLGLVDPERCLDTTVIRMVDAYPVYDEHHRANRDVIKRWLAANLTNLYPAGRAGLHNYNSQDHAMTTASMAVANAREGTDHDPWTVNTDQEYAEAGPTVERLVAQRPAAQDA